ncbi:MAG TPA: MFS transporter, partial [Epsilonproteobacteria bacterium]|nr:MFS transporter [Campylobacterota bacterium]
MKSEQENSIGDSLFFAFLVLFIGAIVRIGASIYLPAMPLISDELYISKAMMSNTLTIYFVVFAIFTLVAGMLSDAYGRKRILMSGMFFFMLGASICALSESYEMLMFGRVIQAFGASMVPGTLMAMIRDACKDIRVVSLMGWLTVLSGLFLVAAPIIGGVLTHFFGWSSNFWFLSFFTFLVLSLTIWRMEETHPSHARVPIDFVQTLKISGTMLVTPSFILVLSPVIAFYAIQGAFLAAVPFILMGEYGLDPVLFGISNVNIVIGLFGGRYLGMHLLKKYGTTSVYRYGAYLAIVVALLFVMITLGVIGGLWSFLIIAGIFAIVFGMMA